MDTEKLDFLRGELTEHFTLPLRYNASNETIVDANGQEVVRLGVGHYLFNNCVDTARTDLHDAIGILMASSLSDELAS